MDAPSAPLRRLARSGWTVLALFAGLSMAVTWPLARGLGHDVPGDYGDPLYVAWALAWVCRQVGLALTGHLEAIAGFWTGNQLHPEPAALALSDHFIAQALPLAPVYWTSGNALLVLGLAYLMALVLNGFCTWALVRELTASSTAGVLAGCTFAFNPFFLVYELSHLQVISAWGMPLTLYGLRRYFEHDRRLGLWIGAAGVVLLSLSSGYYMLMFPPFVLLYAGWEITRRSRWRDLRTWRDLGTAGLGSVLALSPVLFAYVAARQRLGFTRTIDEAARMSATVGGYLEATGPLVIPFACAGLAVVAAVAGRLGWTRHRVPLIGLAVAGGGLAFWLSLGPAPMVGGREWPWLGLYGVLQEHVPGMSVLRVTSRFAVAFLLFLSLAAGLGAALLTHLRHGAALVLGLALISARLNTPDVFPLNRELEPTLDVNPPSGYLTPAPEAPAVYSYLASVAEPAVVAELPFTDLWYNTRYLYFSTFHWHPLVNGFTSFFPPDYLERARWLVNPVRTPDEAFQSLAAAGTTHVVVHTGAWDDQYVRALDEWLTGHGARRHGRFGAAEVYELGR